MIDEQMELGFGTAIACRVGTRNHQRLSRANWWFERMRRVVEEAMDWKPNPTPRPEQIWLPDSKLQGRLPAGAPTTRADEKQMCE
jgi:hypothetical protein